VEDQWRGRSWEPWRSRQTARCSPPSAPVRPLATAKRTRSSRSIRRRFS
jgi:hypothetical protein